MPDFSRYATYIRAIPNVASSAATSAIRPRLRPGSLREARGRERLCLRAGVDADPGQPQVDEDVIGPIVAGHGALRGDELRQFRSSRPRPATSGSHVFAHRPAQQSIGIVEGPGGRHCIQQPAVNSLVMQED